MPNLAIIHEGDVEPQAAYAPHHDVAGMRWGKLMTPPDYRLWLYLTELEDGAEIRWDSQHNDEAISVLEGSLDIQGRDCPVGGTVIIENHVAGTARAAGRTRIVHFGRRDDGPALKHGRHLHVGGPGGAWRIANNPLAQADIWGDSSCGSCDVTFFRVHRDSADDEPDPHSHSADEVIVVVGGSMLLGNREIPPITALSIPGNLRYVQTCGAGGLTFLNFRPGPSAITHYPRGKEPVSLPEGTRDIGEPVEPMVDVPGMVIFHRGS